MHQYGNQNKNGYRGSPWLVKHRSMTVAFTFQIMVTYLRFIDTDWDYHLLDILFSHRGNVQALFTTLQKVLVPCFYDHGDHTILPIGSFFYKWFFLKKIYGMKMKVMFIAMMKRFYIAKHSIYPDALRWLKIHSLL